jgi:DNA-binding response OmpR family regulator
MAKILLAEDDHTMVALLQTLLNMEGFEVTTADMDADVSALIERDKPDVLLMDVHLGQQNGLDVVETIRNNEAFKSLRIVMTSGLDVREECLRRGADEFLMKPFMPDDLISILRRGQ